MTIYFGQMWVRSQCEMLFSSEYLYYFVWPLCSEQISVRSQREVLLLFDCWYHLGESLYTSLESAMETGLLDAA